MKVKKLSSGVTLVHKRVRGVNGVSVSICFNAGQSQEPIIEKDGEYQPVRHLAHVVEHLVAADGSSKKFSVVEKNQLNKKYYFWNAFTGNDYVRYVSSMNKVLLETYFDEITEFISEANFSEEEVEKNKKVVAEEMKTKTTKMIADTKAFEFKHITADKSLQRLAGTWDLELPKRVMTLTKKDVDDFITDLYTLDNLTVFVAGNVSMIKVEKLIKKYFSSRLGATRKYTLPLDKEIKDLLPPNLFAVNSELSDKNNLCIKFIQPKMYDRYKANVYSQLLDKKYFDYIRTKHNIAYGPYISLTLQEPFSYMTAVVPFGDAKTYDAINESLKFFANKEYLATQEELNECVEKKILSYKCDLTGLRAKVDKMYNKVLYKYETKEEKFKTKKAAWEATTLDEYNSFVEDFLKQDPYIFVSAPEDMHIENLTYEDYLAVLKGQKQELARFAEKEKSAPKTSSKTTEKPAKEKQKESKPKKTVQNELEQ